MTTAKQVWIGAGAVVLAAVITGVFTLFGNPSAQQQTNCGSTVANVEGNVTINSDQDCSKDAE